MGRNPRPWPDELVSLEAFEAHIRAEGRTHWRDLPWRETRDPYAILVSEVMLQQTQVKRVLGRWERFLALFPTLDALAAAETGEVLSEWQGLGYNRRALALHAMARRCAEDLEGRLPEDFDGLISLPGVGPATAAGVCAFAYDIPAVYLETNVRAVFLHELFPDEAEVPECEIADLVAQSVPKEDVRGWYYALLDYGAYLKSVVANPNRRAKGHKVQSSFAGSRRQKRAELLRIVLAEPEGIGVEEAFLSLDRIEREAGRGALPRGAFESLVGELSAEGFFRFDGEFLVS